MRFIKALNNQVRKADDHDCHLFAMSKNASHAAGYDLLPFLPPKAEH